MEKVYDKCCVIDVHKKLIVACFKKGIKQKTKTPISLRSLHGAVHIAGRKGLTLQLHILC